MMDIQNEINRRFLLQEEYLGTDKPVNHIKPLVSVTVAAYQHESYIRQCLDGILMQQTNFEFEIIVGEDDSKDKTRDICIEYADKYPDKIRLFLRDRKLSHLKDKNGNLIKRLNGVFGFSLMSARGKYVACCEGDDYWTDALKLQKQGDFLEANPEYSFCFHDAIILNQNTGERNKRIGNRKIDENVDLKSIIIQNNIPTASLLFRRISLPKKYPTWLSKTSKGDYALVIILSEKGLGRYFPEVMSVYRLHEGGVWSFMSMEYKLTESVMFYDLLYDYFEDPAIRKVIVQKRNSTIHSLSLAALRRGEFRKGLVGLIRHWNFTSDKRLKTPIRKILSAIKEGIKHRLKTKNNK